MTGDIWIFPGLAAETLSLLPVWCQASEDYEEAAQVTWFLHEMWLALYFLAERNGATSWLRLQDLVFSS